MRAAFRRFRVAAVSGLMAALMAACATPGPPPRLHYGMADAPEGRSLMWPAAPEIPRYLFHGQLTGEGNFVRDEGEESGVGKFLRWLVGLGASQEGPRVLQRPQAVVGDALGRIYVSDVSRSAVFVFDAPAGELKLLEYAVGLRRFVSPVGLALDGRGDLWVADADLGLVAHVDPTGRTLAPVGEGVLRRPTGLAVDRERGELYVADTYAHDIKVFSLAGQLLRTLGSRGEAPGEFNFPTHLALAGELLYVSDTMNSRVQVLDLQGNPLRVVGQRGLYLGNMVRPKGVSVDSEGHLYVVESYYDHLLIFDRDGRFLMPIGGVGLATGKFYLPSGVWVDPNDRVYIADTVNGRVTVFQYLGGGGNGAL